MHDQMRLYASNAISVSNVTPASSLATPWRLPAGARAHVACTGSISPALTHASLRDDWRMAPA